MPVPNTILPIPPVITAYDIVIIPDFHYTVQNIILTAIPLIQGYIVLIKLTGRTVLWQFIPDSRLFYHEQVTGKLLLGFALIFVSVLMAETGLGLFKKGL